MHGARQRRVGPAGVADARMRLLATVPAFAGCGQAQLERVAALATEVQRGPGAALQRAGRLVRQAVVVVDGLAAERTAGGRDRVVSAGHLIGGDALQAGAAVADRDVVTLTEVQVLVFGLPELATIASLLAPPASDGAAPAHGRAPRGRRWAWRSEPAPRWVAPARPTLA